MLFNLVTLPNAPSPHHHAVDMIFFFKIHLQLHVYVEINKEFYWKVSFNGAGNEHSFFISMSPALGRSSAAICQVYEQKSR